MPIDIAKGVGVMTMLEMTVHYRNGHTRIERDRADVHGRQRIDKAALAALIDPRVESVTVKRVQRHAGRDARDVIEYIDGDAENGPRTGVEISDDDIETEVMRRVLSGSRRTMETEWGQTFEVEEVGSPPHHVRIWTHAAFPPVVLYAKEEHGAFYEINDPNPGGTVGMMYAPMLEDGTPDYANFGEIEVSYDEA